MSKTATPEKSAFDGLLAVIREDPEIGPRFKELEAFDEEVKAAAEYVDLDIAFSPVLLSGDDHTQAVQVDYRSDDGRGVITDPYRVLSVEQLTLARARFLIAKGKAMAPFYERFKR